MKNHKYLDCIITMHSGKTVSNPLQLSETRLLSQMARENESVTVKYAEMDTRSFNITFGTNRKESNLTPLKI